VGGKNLSEHNREKSLCRHKNIDGNQSCGVISRNNLCMTAILTTSAATRKNHQMIMNTQTVMRVDLQIKHTWTRKKWAGNTENTNNIEHVQQLHEYLNKLDNNIPTMRKTTGRDCRCEKTSNGVHTAGTASAWSVFGFFFMRTVWTVVGGAGVEPTGCY
jgi:hypothetical protein